MSNFIEIEYLPNDHICVKLDREEVHNAFNDELICELTDFFLNLYEQESVRLVTLTGKGKSFCAGADLNWMSSMIHYSEKENLDDSEKLFDLFNAIDNCPIPVIAKVNGHALGGGIGLISTCDFALTHDKAKFGFTETRLGLVPAVISSFCLRKIGVGMARAWFLSGEKFSATTAKEMGLVHEVSDVSLFETRYLEIVDSFLMAAPKASREAKKLLKELEATQKSNNKRQHCSLIAKLRVSSEGQEGMSALLEKRQPNWMNHHE